MSTKIPVVDIKGKSVGEVDAPADVFSVEPNEAVVHFVCEGQRFRFYKKNACTKGRAAVSGGGKKLRKQKGTGGARQGGNRAPHWVGGGVVFGPKSVKREFKVNRKVLKTALVSVLSDRHSGGQIRILKDGASDKPKTATFSKFISELSLSGARVGFVVSRKHDSVISKSVRNIRGVDLLTEEKWTPLDIVKTDSLIFSEAAFRDLNSSILGTATTKTKKTTTTVSSKKGA
jgi:large subunit ribosomal protein L4